jgi:hypothetical protein
MCQHTNCLTAQYNKIDASFVSVAGINYIPFPLSLSHSPNPPLPLRQGLPEDN